MRKRIYARLLELEREGKTWTRESLAEDLGTTLSNMQGHIERMRRDGLLVVGRRQVVLESTLVINRTPIEREHVRA